MSKNALLKLQARIGEMVTLLTEIRDLLMGVPPEIPPPGAVSIVNLEELRNMILEAKGMYGDLRLADDLYVETIDLGTARATPKDYSSTLALPGTIALTIFRCPGTFDLWLQKADDAHKITFTKIDYPQTFLLDWFELKKVYITVPSGESGDLVIIAWRRTS